jgi:hypothetical protein
LKFPAVHSQLLSLDGVKTVDDGPLPLPPHLVQVVEQKLQFGRAQLALARRDELLGVFVDIVGHPEGWLWDKGFVAGAEMEGL